MTEYMVQQSTGFTVIKPDGTYCHKKDSVGRYGDEGEHGILSQDVCWSMRNSPFRSLPWGSYINEYTYRFNRYKMKEY